MPSVVFAHAHMHTCSAHMQSGGNACAAGVFMFVPDVKMLEHLNRMKGLMFEGFRSGVCCWQGVGH